MLPIEWNHFSAFFRWPTTCIKLPGLLCCSLSLCHEGDVVTRSTASDDASKQWCNLKPQTWTVLATSKHNVTMSHEGAEDTQAMYHGNIIELTKLCFRECKLQSARNDWSLFYSMSLLLLLLLLRDESLLLLLSEAVSAGSPAMSVLSSKIDGPILFRGKNRDLFHICALSPTLIFLFIGNNGGGPLPSPYLKSSQRCQQSIVMWWFLFLTILR